MNTPTLDRFVNDDPQAYVQIKGRDGKKHGTLHVDGSVIVESNSDDFGSTIELLELAATRLLGNGSA